MSNNPFNPYAGPTRDPSPCFDCPDKHLRPGCRQNCEKNAAWLAEVKRVNDNRRKHERLRKNQYRR